MDKKKDKKIIAVIALAIVCAVAAGAIIFLFLNPQRTTIYTFKETYKAGTVITGEMLSPVQVDSKVIASGTGVDTSSYFITSSNFSENVKNGDVLLVDVGKGSPFMASMITGQASNSIDVRMKDNMVAITIPVNNLSGVTADIKPEAYVNVYVTYNSGETHLLLEKVRVIGVSGSQDGLTGITLELDHNNAKKAVSAVNTGSVYCGLVNSDSYQFDTPDITTKK